MQTTSEPQSATARLNERISDNLKSINADSAYDEMINECYSFEKVGGPFQYLSPSAVMQEMMPTDYRCGFTDWLDSMSEEWVEVDGSYYDRRECENERDEFISELESELDTLREEAEEEESEPDAKEIARLESEIAELRKIAFSL